MTKINCDNVGLMFRFFAVLPFFILMPLTVIPAEWDGNYKINSVLKHCGAKTIFKLELKIKNSNVNGNLTKLRGSGCPAFKTVKFRTRVDRGKFRTKKEIVEEIKAERFGRTGVNWDADMSFTETTQFRLYGDMSIPSVKIETYFKSSQMNVYSFKGTSVFSGVPSDTPTRTTKSSSPSDPLLTAFKSLPAKTRKDIQITLKEKGFYTSTIDGLYGKGTQKSILDFFKDKGLGDDLEKIDLKKELSIIANINLIKEKEEQERLRKEKEIADRKEQERLQAEN